MVEVPSARWEVTGAECQVPLRARNAKKHLYFQLIFKSTERKELDFAPPPGTWNQEFGTQHSEPGTRNMELGTRHLEPGTRHPELGTQNPEPPSNQKHQLK